MKLTKKKVFWISLVGGFIFAFLLFFVLNDYCGLYKDLCRSLYDGTASFLFIFPLIFLFSLITYPLRDEVFQSWLRFAKWWIPLSILLVLVMPDGQGGGYMPSLIDKQTIAFLMSSIFILVSTIKIISKSIELRGK